MKTAEAVTTFRTAWQASIDRRSFLLSETSSPIVMNDNPVGVATVISRARALLDGIEAAGPFLESWPDIGATRPVAPYDRRERGR